MKMTHLFSIVTLVLILSGATIDRTPIFDKQYLPAKKNAQDTNKPLILLFVSDGCRVCDDQKDLLENNNDLKIFIDQNYESATINIDDFDGRAIRDYYNISSIPSMLVVEQDGNVQWTHNGHISTQKLMSKLQSPVSEYSSVSNSQKQVIANAPVESGKIERKTTVTTTTPQASNTVSNRIHEEQLNQKVVVEKPETIVRVAPAPKSSYQIQYGFFGSQSNADAMLTKLAKVGENGCYITSEVRDGKTYYRVLSERYRGKELATATQQKIKGLGIAGNIKEVQ